MSEWSDAVKGRTQKKSFETSYWKECPDNADDRKKYSIDENNPRIAIKVTDNGYCTIIGNTPLPLDKVTSWNIKILKSRENNGKGIYIGVAPFDINQNEDDNHEKCGWYFDCYCSSLFSGPPNYLYQEEYGPRKKEGKSDSDSDNFCLDNDDSDNNGHYFHTGDNISVIINTTKGDISFILGGVNYGIAYEEIPLDKPLVPCVILCGLYGSVELDLSSKANDPILNTSIQVPFNIRTKSGITWDSIILSWDAIDGAEFYQIEVDGSSTWYTSTTNSFTKRKFLEDTEHTFRVRTMKDNSVSEWSDGVKGRIQKKTFRASFWKKYCSNDDNILYKYSVDEETSRIVFKEEGSYPDIDSYSTIIGNVPIPLNQVTSWNIRVLNSPTYSSTIFNGVAPSDINQNDGNNFNKCGWYFNCGESLLWSGPPHNYKNQEYGPRKEKHERCDDVNTVFGVIMDTTKGELSFALNGVNIGIAYEGIPLDKPLVPCAILGSIGDSVKLDFSEIKETINNSIPIPSGFTTTSKTWDSITLTWRAIKDVSFYQIEVDGSKSWNATTMNTFTKRGIHSDTEYNFRVRAVRKNSVSEWSDIVTGRTQKKTFKNSWLVKCPDDISDENKYSVDESNLRIATKINKGHCTIVGNIFLSQNKTISWNIKILKSRDNNGGGILIGVAPFNINRIDIVNSINYGWYYYCYLSALCSGPPHNYRDKEYDPRKMRGNYIHTGDNVGVVMDTTKGNLSFVLNGVNYGIAYEGIPLDRPLVPCVLLKYGNDSVEFDPSSKVKENEDKHLSIPSNFMLISITHDSIKFSWDVDRYASFYQIEVYKENHLSISTTNTFMKNSLSPDTTYYFRVRAIGENGVGKWSGYVKIQTRSKPVESRSIRSSNSYDYWG